MMLSRCYNYTPLQTRIYDRKSIGRESRRLQRERLLFHEEIMRNAPLMKCLKWVHLLLQSQEEHHKITCRLYSLPPECLLHHCWHNIVFWSGMKHQLQIVFTLINTKYSTKINFWLLWLFKRAAFFLPMSLKNYKLCYKCQFLIVHQICLHVMFC